MDTRRTIIHVSVQDPEHLSGGQGVAVANLANEQVALGFDVVWISPCLGDQIAGEQLLRDGKLHVAKVKIGDSPIPSLFETSEESQRARESFGDAFTSLIRGRFRPRDCYIHLHGFIEEPRRARVLRNSGYDVVSTFHMFLTPRAETIEQQQGILSRLKQIEREAILANTHIIVNSHGMAEELRRLAPEYAGELFIIPNGVAREDLSPLPSTTSDVPQVVTYGRISLEKGYEYFIEAAKIVTRRRQENGGGNVRFAVFGLTDLSQRAREEYSRHLKRLADGHENIQLDFNSTGIWGSPRLDYLDRSCIGVVCSSYEPFGLVLIEMMARGLPIVSTRTHGARDILAAQTCGKTECGWLTPVHDANAVADAIEWLLDHPHEAAAMGEAGRRRVERHYTSSSTALRTLEIYKGAKSIGQGPLSESAEVHPALKRAAEDGRMFALRQGQLHELDRLDDERLANLMVANLFDLAKPAETQSKLLAHLRDSDFRLHLARGYSLIDAGLGTAAAGRCDRMAIVVEPAEQPGLFNKDAQTSLFGHIGRGVKSGTAYSSCYISYNSLRFALLQGREAEFQAAIAQLAALVGKHCKTVPSRRHEAVFFLGDNHPSFYMSRGRQVAGVRRIVCDAPADTVPRLGNRLHEAVFAEHGAKSEGSKVEAAVGVCEEDRIPFLELHLTNACNLRCQWCTYLDLLESRPEDHSLPFETLERVASFNPEEILLVGGGEPTVYRKDGKTFNDAILRLRELLPDVRLRLITNGVLIPHGRWTNEIDEVSVSLDDATSDAFWQHKHSSAFGNVWRNIHVYLKDSPIPRVRVTMVYDRRNLEEALGLAEQLQAVWQNLVGANEIGPLKAAEFRFLLFPRADDTCAADPYSMTRLTLAEQRRWEEKLAGIRDRRPELADFISAHTNLATRVFDELIVPPARRCLSNANYVLLGADGLFYPCFAMCAAGRQHNLGPVAQPPLELMKRREEHFHAPPRRCGDGCRPHTVFYGLRAIHRLSDSVLASTLRNWDRRLNLTLEARVAREGFEFVLARLNQSPGEADEATGIVWFPGRIRYKLLDHRGTSNTPEVVTGSPHTPHGAGAYVVQYNESRGVPQREDDALASGAARGKVCDFCDLLKSNKLSHFLLCDLESHFGVPYSLVADSRPFFDRHMLVLAKSHSGRRFTYEAFRELVWILNVVFPGMKGNIGTGIREAHLHMHIYDIQFPIEGFPVETITEGKSFRIGLLKRPAGGPDSDLAHFVIESGHVDILARHAYWLLKELESHGLLLNIILAANRVYLMPLVKKTVGADYPVIFDSFKDPQHRETDELPRCVGPVESAGIWLCYSRDNHRTMTRMFDAVNLDVYRKLLSDTGLHTDSPLYRNVAALVRALGQERPCFASFYDPRMKSPELAGGKGSNLHFLSECGEGLKEASRRIKQSRAELLNIPRGYVLTTELFKELVHGIPGFKTRLEELDTVSDQLRQADSEHAGVLERRIRLLSMACQEDVLALPLPSSQQGHLQAIFEALGQDLAIRSSATSEDSRCHAAAGCAASVLHVISPNLVWNAIRTVWASLYDERCTRFRIAKGFQHTEASMAVILQQLISAEASGTVVSVTPEGRPVFNINANEGLGLSVVEGSGATDHWCVGPDGRHILEAEIRTKQTKTILRDSGGVQTVSTDELSRPCLTDSQVIDLASLAKQIATYYRNNGLADHVDIEFAIDRARHIFITQTRAETSAAPKRGVVRVATVDPSRVTGERRFAYREAIVANEGAASGVLQLLEAEQFDAVQQGAIAVTNDTTDRWNGVFHKLAGVITKAGNDSSHAAITAREIGIPCLVGAGAAVDLKDYTGQVVTLDARKKTVYIGEQPIQTMEMDRSFWAGADQLAERAAEERNTGLPLNKIERALDADRLSTVAEVRQTFEGCWLAVPHVQYGYFQLDYYHRAWRMLPKLLLELFPEKLAADDPLCRLADDVFVRDRILWMDITGKERSPVIEFLSRLTREELDRLADARLAAIRRIEQVLCNVRQITESSTTDVVDGLVELLAWMHLAIPFSHTVEALYAYPQLRYIDPRFRSILEGQASLFLPPELRRSMNRQREESLRAIAEELRVAFGVEPDCDRRQVDQWLGCLPETHPALHEKIEQLSLRFKKGTEDIRVPNESEEYMHEIADLLESGPRLHNGPVDFDDACDSAVIDAVNDAFEKYLSLKHSMVLAVKAARLREYGHQVATRCQRKIASLMLARAPAHILDEPGNIFEIATEEFIALFRDPQPDYIRESFEWRRKLEAAESMLEQSWDSDPRTATDNYADAVGEVMAGLRRQLKSARYEGVRTYYFSQISSLAERRQRLRRLAVGEIGG